MNWKAMVLTTITAVVAVIILFASMSIFFSLLTFYAMIAIAVIVIIISISMTRAVPGWGDRNAPSLDDMARSLFSIDRMVERRSDSILVDTPNGTRVKIILKMTRKGPRLVYRVIESAHGWVYIAILMLPFYSAIFVIPLLTYQRVTAREFLRQNVEKVGDISTIMKKSELTQSLDQGLAEGYRISTEAYEGVVSSYHDELVISVSFGLFVWVIFLAVSAGIFGFTEDLVVPLILWTLVSAALTLTVILWVRKRWLGKISELKLWRARIEQTFLLRKGIDEGEGSTMELLFDISSELPKWMDLKRKAFMYHHPLISLWFVMSTMFLSQTLLSAILSFGILSATDPWSRAFILIAILLLIELNVVIYIYVKHKDKVKSERIIGDWHARYADLNKRIEDLLRGP